MLPLNRRRLNYTFRSVKTSMVKKHKTAQPIFKMHQECYWIKMNFYQHFWKKEEYIQVNFTLFTLIFWDLQFRSFKTWCMLNLLLSNGYREMCILLSLSSWNRTFCWFIFISHYGKFSTKQSEMITGLWSWMFRMFFLEIQQVVRKKAQQFLFQPINPTKISLIHEYME